MHIVDQAIEKSKCRSLCSTNRNQRSFHPIKFTEKINRILPLLFFFIRVFCKTTLFCKLHFARITYLNLHSFLLSTFFFQYTFIDLIYSARLSKSTLLLTIHIIHHSVRSITYYVFLIVFIRFIIILQYTVNHRFILFFSFFAL